MQHFAEHRPKIRTSSVDLLHYVLSRSSHNPPQITLVVEGG